MGLINAWSSLSVWQQDNDFSNIQSNKQHGEEQGSLKVLITQLTLFLVFLFAMTFELSRVSSVLPFICEVFEKTSPKNNTKKVEKIT